MDGFFDYFDLGLTVQFALEIFENFSGVLKGLIVKIEQDKTGVIRHFILNKKILDFPGRSASEIENPGRMSAAGYPPRLFDHQPREISDTVSVRLRRALAEKP